MDKDAQLRKRQRETEKVKNLITSLTPREQEVAFARMYRSARENTILDPRTTLLLHYASAMALACYP